MAIKKYERELWEKLAKELRAAIPKLDTEGLAFLVEQSRIHLYNMQVDELNKLKEAANKPKSRAGSRTAGKAKPQAARSSFSLKIDQTGAGYYLQSSLGDTIFSKNEMVSLIKLAHGPGTLLEAAGRLHAWFVKERSDVLNTLQIASRLDKKMQTITSYIKKNFKLKK